MSNIINFCIEIGFQIIMKYRLNRSIAPRWEDDSNLTNEVKVYDFKQYRIWVTFFEECLIKWMAALVEETCATIIMSVDVVELLTSWSKATQSSLPPAGITDVRKDGPGHFVCRRQQVPGVGDCSFRSHRWICLGTLTVSVTNLRAYLIAEDLTINECKQR